MYMRGNCRKQWEAKNNDGAALFEPNGEGMKSSEIG
jgi:hypothetical protein